MSLYSSNIHLLPRPPRSLFSIGSESTRAALPDFANVDELSQFISRIFDWQIKIPRFYEQAIFSVCMCFFMVLVIGLIMVRRILQGKFWLVRIIRRPTGVIIVLNPILAFFTMAALYVVVFEPFFAVATRQYSHHTGPPRNVMVWLTLPWIVLFYGQIWAVLGTYFAIPDALSSPLALQEVSSFKRFIRRADVINSVSLLVPIIVTITIATPTIFCNIQWEKALAMEREWQLEYSSMPTFTQGMVQQSQVIWFEALKAAKIGSIIFVMWTIFSFGLSLVYFCVATRLISAVREDINQAKERENGCQDITEKHPVVVVQDLDLVADSSISMIPAVPQSTTFASIPPGQYNPPESDPVDHISIHSKDLEQALFHIYSQLVAIGPGAAGFGGISLVLALTMFSKLEQPSQDGGHCFEAYLGGVWMAFIYTADLAGLCNILAVAYHSYDRISHSPMIRQIRFRDIIRGPTFVRSTLFGKPLPALAGPTASSPSTDEGDDTYDEIIRRTNPGDRQWKRDSEAYSLATLSPSSISKLL